MSDFSIEESESPLQMLIEQNLQQIALQMGHPIDPETAEHLYQEAVNLLGTIAYEPITLARVAGTLLVYQGQNIETTEELEWFKTQVQQCADAEEVEELIESLHRTDAL